MKKLFLTITALVIVAGLALTACSPKATETPAPTTAPVTTEAVATTELPAKQITIAFVGSMIAGNEMYTGISNAFQQIADENGIKYVTADAQMDEAKQISDVENLTAQGVDVLIVDAVDPEGLDPYIVKAMDAGIKIVASGVELKHYDTWGLVDQYLAGELAVNEAVKWINDKFDGKAEIAILDDPSNGPITERTQAFLDVIARDLPESKIVGTTKAVSQTEGMSATENLLQAHPNIKVIIVGSEDAAFGAVEAVKGMGLDTEDFGIFTVNGSPTAIKLISEGSILRCSVRFEYEKIPFDIMGAAIKLVNGEPVDKKLPVTPTAVTIENAAQYLTQ